MEKTFAIIYFISFASSFLIILYAFTKSNFEKCFKQGRIEAIKVSTFILTFILASLFALAMKNIMECVYTLIN